MAEGSQGPRSKLEEQATAKAELSYSYWAANAVTAAPPAQPKKLTEEEAAAHHKAIEEHKETTGASAWNRAGTFEERNMTEWARWRLAELLTGCDAGRRQGAAVCITSLSSCTGEAHQWIVRGKKRGGFELQLCLQWRAELGGDDWAAGTARVPEASADELDELRLEGVEVTERSKGLGAEAEARAHEAARAALLPAVERQLRELLEQLKQR